MSFVLFLLVATLITGCCAVLMRLVPERVARLPQLLHGSIEQLSSFFSIFLFVIVLRSFVIEPFRIPSSSLEPTLLVGDFVVVNKFIYGLRFPYFEHLLMPIDHPKRGDVIVLRWPPNERYDYIKRVIGIPGDTVVYKNKLLTVNGHAFKQSHATKVDGVGTMGERIELYRLQECLNPHRCHQIYQNPSKPAYDFTITVPPGYYFAMGDNRDNSSDSRYWGFVPEKDLKGKAMAIWMSWDAFSTSIRWSRIGRIIH